MKIQNILYIKCISNESLKGNNLTIGKYYRLVGYGEGWVSNLGYNNIIRTKDDSVKVIDDSGFICTHASYMFEMNELYWEK